MNKIKRIKKIIKKRVKLSSLLILIVTFSVNAFAWFVYSTKVDTGISAHIKGWTVDFVVGGSQVEQYIVFNVADLYPGMPNYTDSLKISNSGETKANISYEIEELNILGVETLNDGTEITSAMINASLQNDYPFKVTLSLSSDELEINKDESFNLTVSWPFESGDDELDTYWGNKAYYFKANNPDSSSISIKVKISAEQEKN